MSTFDQVDYDRARAPELPPARLGEDQRWAIERQFRDLEALLGAYLCIHDVSGVFRLANGESWFLASRIIHQAPICRLLHTQECIQHCSQAQNELARKKAKPFTHHCWKGASELVVPVIREGAHLASIFAGAARSTRAQADRDFPEAVTTAQLALPRWPAAMRERLGRVLTAFGDSLLYRLEHLYGDDDQVRPDLHNQDRHALIRRWLHVHAHESVGLADLAQALSLSESRTSHVVQECYGQSFRALLHHERLERARRMLLNSRNLAVSEIAYRAGFGDERHFARSFKKKYDLPPGQYRRRYQAG